MESIFLDVDPPTGLLSFAPAHEARGATFSARCQLRVRGEEQAPPDLRLLRRAALRRMRQRPRLRALRPSSLRHLRGRLDLPHLP